MAIGRVAGWTARRPHNKLTEFRLIIVIALHNNENRTITLAGATGSAEVLSAVGPTRSSLIEASKRRTVRS